MKLKGTIRRSDLEGGLWTLVGDDGTTYQLSGSTKDAKDGARVEVDGKVDKASMGFGMVGTQLAVSSIKTL